MNTTALAVQLAAIIGDALAGRRSEVEIAKALIDTAFESGIAPALLMQHLSERGKQHAELAADIAEFAKLEVARMKTGG